MGAADNVALVRAFDTPADVEAWLRVVAPFIGWGFHVDTSAEEYADGQGADTFTHAQAVGYDLNMERACRLMDRAGLDIYEVANLVLAEELPPLNQPGATTLDRQDDCEDDSCPNRGSALWVVLHDGVTIHATHDRTEAEVVQSQAEAAW